MTTEKKERHRRIHARHTGGPPPAGMEELEEKVNKYK